MIALPCISAFALPAIRLNKGLNGRNTGNLQPTSLSMFKNHHGAATAQSHNLYGVSDIGLDIAKLLMNALKSSKHPWILLVFSWWKTVPLVLRSIFSSVYPGDLFLFALFQLSHKRTLRLAHKLQIIVWRVLSMGQVLTFNKSILGFLEERATLLSKVMGCSYIVKLTCMLLGKLGFHMRADLPILLSKVMYALYISNFIDLFKTKFLHMFLPNLSENRRQSYVVNRSTSVVIWVVGVLVACEMVSTFLRVPLSSTLAFGGVGGLAIGLSARDIAANFLGGMLLLFNEPFTPGDMVTFRTGNTELIGRVERVGWGQTRIRGRDTRPTYIPNSHFVQTAVTNMERITHRKFEIVLQLRYQDGGVMNDIIAKIREGIRTIPKLDILSMPFRVNFVKIGTYGLEIEITCYFATKSIDEFLALQQMTNQEILKAISASGGALALPTSQVYHNQLQIPQQAVAVQQQQQIFQQQQQQQQQLQPVQQQQPLPQVVQQPVSAQQQQQQQQLLTQQQFQQQQQQITLQQQAQVQMSKLSTPSITASTSASSGTKAVASAPLTATATSTASATPATPAPVTATATASTLPPALAAQAVAAAGSGSVSAVVPASAPVSPSVPVRSPQPQPVSPLSGATNVAVAGTPATATSTTTSIPSPMISSSDNISVRKIDAAGAEGSSGTGAGAGTGVAAASRTRSTVTATAATVNPSPTLASSATNASPIQAQAQATGEIYSQQPVVSASTASPSVKTQSIDHTPAVKQQAQQVNSPDIIAQSGEKYSFAPAPFLLDGPGSSYPDMTLATVMKGTEVLSSTARERLMSGQGVDMLPGIEKVSQAQPTSVLQGNAVSIDTMTSRVVPFSSTTTTTQSQPQSQPQPPSVTQVTSSLITREAETAVANSLSLSSYVQPSSVDTSSTSTLPSSLKTATFSATLPTSVATATASVSPWKSLQDVAPAMVVSVASLSTSPSPSPPVAYSPTLMTSLDNIRMPVTPPREREKVEESFDTKGRSVDNSPVIGASASLRNTMSVQGQGLGQGQMQNGQSDQKKKKSPQADAIPSSDSQTPWFRATPGSVTVPVTVSSVPPMTPVPPTLPLSSRQQMTSPSTPSTASTSNPLTEVTAMLPSSSSSSSSSTPPSSKDRLSESERIAEDSRVKGASLYPKRKHSIDDVDDADNNWLEIDTTFGEW